MTRVVLMSSRGRITFPKELRDQLSLIPGSKLAFSKLSDGTVIMRVKRRKLSSLGGILSKPGQSPVLIKEMKR